MPRSKEKVQKLLETSKEVLLDCSLANGAIIAANSDHPDYPKNVQDYRYVWVRDASFVCMASNLLDQKDISGNFFNWCLDRAEGFSKNNLFLNAYHPNGTMGGIVIPPETVGLPKETKRLYMKTIHYGLQFQPDQNANLLIAINHFANAFGTDLNKNNLELVQKAADGIAASWRDYQFAFPVFDIWEERFILPGDYAYHTYSLAMCIRGLEIALDLSGARASWRRVRDEMLEIFDEIYNSADIIPRSYSRKDRLPPHIHTKGKKIDSSTDGSLVGLVFPAGVLDATDEKMRRTVEVIVRENDYDNGGIMRYPGDKYCGGVKDGWITLTGAGAWPWLNFWVSIYFAKAGNQEAALKYYNWVLDRVDRYIPEQIFRGKKRGVGPYLSTAHAMFVLATKELGFLD